MNLLYKKSNAQSRCPSSLSSFIFLYLLVYLDRPSRYRNLAAKLG